jgi:hypothetical protein
VLRNLHTQAHALPFDKQVVGYEGVHADTTTDSRIQACNQFERRRSVDAPPESIAVISPVRVQHPFLRKHRRRVLLQSRSVPGIILPLWHAVPLIATQIRGFGFRTARIVWRDTFSVCPACACAEVVETCCRVLFVVRAAARVAASTYGIETDRPKTRSMRELGVLHGSKGEEPGLVRMN